MKEIKVAAIQFPLAENQQFSAFCEKVINYILESKKNNAELIIFPELILTELIEWNGRNEPEQMMDIAKKYSQKYMDLIIDQSKKLNISIMGGTFPRSINGKIYNTAILALPDGQFYLQDKIFLTPSEKNWGWETGDTLQIINAPWGKTVLLICFDSEFPCISEMLSKESLDLIIVPSWTSTLSGLNRVDWCSKSRAVEHFCYVVKTGTVPANDSTQDHFGFSTIVSPQDLGFPFDVIQGQFNQAGIIYGSIHLDILKQVKSQTGYNPSFEQALRLVPIQVNKI